MKLPFNRNEYNRWYRSTEHGQLVRKNLADNLSVEKKILYRATRRAKERGLDINIELSDIIIPEYCPITNLKLQSHKGSKGFLENSPSLDRKDISKGYVKGNVAVISMRANKLKSDFSVKEIARLYEYTIRK